MKSVSDDLEYIQYYNCDVYELKNGIIENYNITSLENIKYSYDKKIFDIYNKYTNKLVFINKSLRENNNIKYIDIIDKLEESINNSPFLDIDFTVYRGINYIYPDLKIGDILENNGFMYTSLDYDTAEFYCDDTSKCYIYDNYGNISKCDLDKSFKNLKSTMLEIIIPKNINFLDYTYYSICYRHVYSQILLSHKTKLKILDIKNIKNITHINAIII